MDNVLSHKIIGAAIEVHKILGGPGLLESVYEAALFHELVLCGLSVQRQVQVDVMYKGMSIKDPLYLDLLVDNKVIVEVKATEKEHSIYEVQLLTYLRLTGIKLGLVINFGKDSVKDGVSRVVNG
jgi:GxxExxY protein